MEEIGFADFEDNNVPTWNQINKEREHRLGQAIARQIRERKQQELEADMDREGLEYEEKREEAAVHKIFTKV